MKLARQKRRKPWLTHLSRPEPIKVVAVALANKMARMAWAMMVRAAYGRVHGGTDINGMAMGEIEVK